MFHLGLSGLRKKTNKSIERCAFNCADFNNEIINSQKAERRRESQSIKSHLKKVNLSFFLVENQGNDLIAFHFLSQFKIPHRNITQVRHRDQSSLRRDWKNIFLTS